VKTFDQLYAELLHKTTYREELTGTVRLVDAGVHAVGKKVVEEAAEAWMAAEFEGKERAAEEIAKLIFFTQVLMLAADVSLEDVYRHL
jgi:phosphoribosyl-ATP pyrophosphohydrolase